MAISISHVSNKLLKLHIWKTRNVYHGLTNLFSQLRLEKKYTSLSTLKIECLKNRSLIQLSGPDTSAYLQGLITNDIGHFLHRSHSCMFAMFLNQQGRVLYDTILYKISSSPSEEFLLECDTTVVSELIRHLQLYKVRKKVEILPVSDKMVWSAFSPLPWDSLDVSPTMRCSDQLAKNLKATMILEDPRHVGLGYRIVLPANSLPKLTSEKEIEDSYEELRYRLGIGEGIADHPPGKCFPLECNLDYLHGISFHKGCYIGQELTARIHHTGVVRKRLMPIRLEVEEKEIPENCIIHNDKNENVGRFRKGKGRYGLALLRIAESLAAKYLVLKDLNIKLETRKPFWWPIEAAKSH
ncbi:putative transferase CAF17 homolog, mitochondrial [Centruroides sculpturatus]|uniref:putative transferase CAF17 homolog, mitochondrial n=1 Tax=Centruroides sculpturatus TaxID=218467 RepID=UPI000C6EF8CE|nr:putative transferase CAF17 homolog, mitochondrial [Centruroides sculpturatus]XP_023235923.1 putative transferase CAF17 homolog, mitochondrial [Centruroides sculpturatus]